MKKLTLLTLLLLLSLSVVSEEITCEIFPDEDLIILEDTTFFNVSKSNFIQDSDLPKSWSLGDLISLNQESLEDSIRKSRVVTINDYKAEFFLGSSIQFIYSDDSEIYIKIESFTKYKHAKNIAQKYNQAFLRGSNIDEYQREPDFNNGFSAKFQGTGADYVFGFVDGKNRYIYIQTPSYSDAKKVANLYKNLKDSLVIKSTKIWEAQVCKEEADDCTQYIDYSSIYEDVYIDLCQTKSKGKTIACPDRRISLSGGVGKIPFASCKKGDILELEYTKNIVYPIKNRFWNLDNNYLVSEYPTKEIKYSLQAPAGMPIRFGDAKPKTTKKGDLTTYTWQSENTPPFEYESRMPPKPEVIQQAKFSSLKSWEDIEDWFEDLFEGAISKEDVSSQLGKIVEDNDDDKPERIYDWVKDNLRYEYSEFGFLTGFEPHPVEEILDYSMGDCKDQSTLLISLLRAAGYTANPVLVVREGLSIDVPSTIFYHAIVVVSENGGETFLDPTCDFCPYGYIPQSYQGNSAIILSDGKTGFIKLPEFKVDSDYIYEKNHDIELSPDGSAKINTKIFEQGTDALDLKTDLEEGDLEELLEGYVEDVCESPEYVSHKIINGDYKDYQVELITNCKKLLEITENEKFIFSFWDEARFSSILSEDSRKYPIVFKDNFTMENKLELIIPEGYEVEAIPEEISLNKPFGSYELSCEKQEGKIVCRKKIIYKESRISLNEVDTFKTYAEKLNANENVIILTKETPKAEQKEEKQEETPQKNTDTDESEENNPDSTIVTTKEKTIEKDDPFNLNIMLVAGIIFGGFVIIAISKFKK